MSTHEDVLKELKAIREEIRELYEIADKIDKIGDAILRTLSEETLTLKIRVDSKELEDVYYRLQKTLDIWKDRSEYLRESFFRGLESIHASSLNTLIEKKTRQFCRGELFKYIDSVLKRHEFYKKISEIEETLESILRRARVLQRMESCFFKTQNVYVKDDKIYNEDALLPPALKLIQNTHQFVKLYRVEMHKRLGKKNMEFDAIALFFTEKGNLRSVAIELKETNFDKLAEQLIERQPYTHYIYGVFRGNPFYAVRRLMELDLLNTFDEKGIGLLVIDYSGNLHQVFPSKYNPGGRIEFIKTLQDFSEKQL